MGRLIDRKLNTELRRVTRLFRDLGKIERGHIAGHHLAQCVDGLCDLDDVAVEISRRVKRYEAQLHQIGKACASCGAVACCDCTVTTKGRGR